MKQCLAVFIGLLLIFSACQSTEEEVDQVERISKVQAALIGTWQEEDSLENTIWTFDRYEVKWKGFSHFYKVSGDSLIISGMVYTILEQSDKKMKFLKLNGKPCLLNRKQ